MSSKLDEQISQLKQTIAEIEAQRTIIGDGAVEAALIPFRQKLADLEAQREQIYEEPHQLPARQRKLVTLLFMDVVGSTAMTQHLDPEDTLEIMDNALRSLAVPVSEHGGHVTRFMGDGFKAVFGDPLAREDDPEQAIRAGLEILEVAKSLAKGLESQHEVENFTIRIGIDTGLVALGGFTEAEDTIMGRPVNLAARLESAAPPGSLLISHNTYRHLRGVFDVEPQDPITAKGFPEPVPAYLVLRDRPRAFRVPLLVVEGVETRMVGRETELKFLQDALLTTMEEGEGQVVTVTGEAGVGKSRLLYEFQNWFELLPPPPVLLFVGRGRHESQAQAYSLLRDLFAFRFQILDDDPAQETRRKIEAGFGQVFGPGEDGLMRTHILGQLMGFDFRGSPHLRGVLDDPEQLRKRGLSYLRQYFQRLAKDNPALILLEDIHWADHSSLDMINKLGEETPGQRLLIVCAGRPILFERRPFWGEGETFHTRLNLRPLSKRESRQLIAEILQLVEHIPVELRELVVSGAEGNPFYLEELIKMLIENGVIHVGEETWQVETSRLAQVDVPSTLSGVLQARLDSLPRHERSVLQQASVVGRLFWDRLVAYIQAEGGDGSDLQLVPLALASLRSRELIYRREDSAFTGAVEFLFKHDVLREVTYESVLKGLRKTYHGLVADWLINNGGDRSSEFSGLIAEHLLLAGREDLAGEYFKQAGDSALVRFANAEAENYYRQALKLTASKTIRADILSGLGKALRLQIRHEEARPVLREAIDLYLELGDSDQVGEAYTNLAHLDNLIDDQRAWNVSQEGLEILAGAEDSPGYAHLLAEAGRVAFFGKKGEQAVQLCQRAIEMADRVGAVKVSTDARISMALASEDVARSVSTLEEVVALSEENNLMESAARAHINLGYFHNEYLIDLLSAQRHSLRAIEIKMKTGDLEAITIPYSNAIEIIIFLGEFDLAEKLFSKAYSETIKSGSLKEYYAKLDRSRLLLAKGDWSSAMEITWDIWRQHEGNTQRVGGRNIDFATAILELNRFGMDVDLGNAESALKENLEIGHRPIQSNSLLSRVYLRQGRLTEAADQLALSKDEQSGYSRENNMTIVFHALAEAELALAEERWTEAVMACDRAIEIFKKCGHKLGWARQLIDLGDALVGRNEAGDKEQARQVYLRALEMYTQMGSPGYIQVLEGRLEDFKV